MGRGLPCCPLDSRVPSPGCLQEKQVSQIWSAACSGNHTPSGGRDTQPTLPQ